MTQPKAPLLLLLGLALLGGVLYFTGPGGDVTAKGKKSRTPTADNASALENADGDRMTAQAPVAPIDPVSASSLTAHSTANPALPSVHSAAPATSPPKALTVQQPTSGTSAAGTNPAAQSRGSSGAEGLLERARHRGISRILRQFNMQDPAERALAVQELSRLENLRMAAVRQQAAATGVPLRIPNQPNGGAAELIDFDDDGEPLYRTTFNTRAAISTAADIVARPVIDGGYNLDGSGLTLGVWDAGWVRGSHQEFQASLSAVTYGDSAGYYDDHGTHVGGTMIAAGVVPRAKGMAPKAKLRSYDWNYDDLEMLMAGAVTDTNLSLLPISNHSYGIIARSEAMGVYETLAADMDAVAYDTPHYLQVWSAGNDQDRLRVWSGFQSLHYYQTAKNILTVGAVSDAVAYGERAVRNATMSEFSSWGPTDDGRIKPDVVGNGVSVYSPVATGNSAYDGTYSGTSMAAPNVAGSAALLVQQYVREFGVLPRADLLKALLIHTADDLGNAGPDYKHGWGLVNTKAAADLIASEAASPGSIFLRGVISNALTPPAAYTKSFTWDGVSPIRATLVWTDPPGDPQSATDSRSNNLVHDLDLRIVGPDGATNLPYVMPFVGNWSYASMDAPAIRGTNRTDNVEQVFIAPSNAVAGTYRLEVPISGSFQSVSAVFAPSFTNTGMVVSANASNGTIVKVGDLIASATNASTNISVLSPDAGMVKGVVAVGTNLRSGQLVASIERTNQSFYVVLSGAGSTPTNFPPSVTLEQPADGQVFAPYDTVNFSAAASDRSPGTVASVQFLVDGEPGTPTVTNNAVLSGGKWVASWTPPTASSSVPGAGRLWKARARVVDNLSSATDSPRRSFIVDYPLPGELTSFVPPALDEHVQAMAVDHLGRLYLGGRFSKINDGGGERNAVRLARLQSSGLVDTNYPSVNGPDAQVRTLQFSRLHNALYIGGDFAKFGPTNRTALARVHIGNTNVAKTDGTLDADFNPVITWPESTTPPSVRAVVVQDDGKIIIGGRFTRIGGVTRKNLARLNFDGSLDASFAPEPNSAVNSIVLLPGGKIMAGGQFTTIAGVTSPGLARLNPDGTRDASFSVGSGVDAGFNGPVNAVAVATDGSVYAGGLFSSYQGRPYHNNLAKLTATGSIVGTFNFTPGLNGAVHHVQLQPGGEVLVAGEFTQAGNNNLKIPAMAVGRVMQFLPNGEIDETFNVAPQGDGSFSTGADGPVHAVTALADGNFLVAGGFTEFNGELRERLAVITGLDALAPVLTSRAFAVLNAGGDLDFTLTSSAPRGQSPDVAASYSVDPATPLPRGVELDSVTGRLTGVPLDHGQHRIMVNVTSRLGTSSMPFDLHVGDVPVPYERWAKAWFRAGSTNPAIAGPSVVRNSAGLKNLMVYAMDGGHPDHASPALWPQMSFTNEGGKTYPVLSAGKYGAATVSRAFQWSDTLGAWSSASNAIVPLPDPSPDRIRARAAKSTDEAPKQFLRLRIANP
jgi:uncharacterized delta-60 repeat protein